MSAPVLHLNRRNSVVGARLDPATVAAPARRAPVRGAPLAVTGRYPPLFAVMGAHGGAGASTLARWWAPAADTGRAWPASPATTRYVLVAARLCMPGLTAAADRLREWHAGLAPDGVTVIGLVLTATRPGRVPSVVRGYRGVVADLVEYVYDIGWHDELLGCELDELAEFQPADPPPPRRTRLREAVPADVYDTGTRILNHLAVTHKHAAALPDSETT
ncbi:MULTISPECIES: hypothetical protein [Nocardia]|uniref:hypothetical protein n=1 Tax=Nocardia TaxID=1817 RepID=UPI0024545474|nr:MULTISPECIES: hypothetical protein [Nocardia]